MITDNNKKSYFLLSIDLPNIYGLSEKALEQKIETNIDIILASMTATSNIYKFRSNERYVYLFQT